MNGFKKNKNNTAKRNVKPDDVANDQLGENTSAEYQSIKKKINVGSENKKGKK